jgi:hypothetical protein
MTRDGKEPQIKWLLILFFGILIGITLFALGILLGGMPEWPRPPSLSKKD